jgi:hypothetical protein
MAAHGADGADSSEVAAIGERGCDAELHLRVRANALLLRAPIVTVPRVFPCGGVRDRSRGEPEGDTMVVAGSRVGSELRLTAVGRGRTVTRTLALTPTLGWSFFLPWLHPFGGRHWPLSALWVGGMLLPAAYWAGRARARWGLPVLGATIVLGLGALPVATGLAVPVAGEWGAAVLGAAAGWALGRRTTLRASTEPDASAASANAFGAAGDSGDAGDPGDPGDAHDAPDSGDGRARSAPVPRRAASGSTRS